MKMKFAKKLTQVAEENGFELSLYEGYSGRGMYGKSTTAVTGSLNSLIMSVAVSSKEIAESDNDFEEFVRSMGMVQKDSMGKDDLVFY